jgi:hypothetical protein
MLRKIPDGFQSLHFDTLTLNPTTVNWVKRWSKNIGNFIHRPHDVGIVH